MVFGYVRVSTSHQNYDMQIDSLETFGVKKKNIYSDKASGAKSERKGLNELMMKLREGDTVIVWKMCRIARNTKHMLNLMEFFENNGIDFKSIQEPFLDTKSPYGKFIFTLFSALYQMEREINTERVTAGVRSAMNRGVKVGRPKGMTEELKRKSREAIIMHRDEKLSIKTICKELSISQGSLYKMFDYRKYDYKMSHKNIGNKNASTKVKLSC